MGAIGSDHEGFEQWYVAEHARLVAALAVVVGHSDVAQELAAEAFARALERWERVAAMESPTGWVRIVALNLAKRRGRRLTLESRALRRRPLAVAADPPDTIDPALWAAVRSLPDRQRSVIGLRVVLDLSQEETARLLGIRPGTVSATLVEARRRVERALAESAPDDLEEVGHG